MGASLVTTVVGIVVIMIVFNLVRLGWMARLSGHERRIARIADSDAHLSFDERIAERMRELESDKALTEPVERAAPPPTPLAARDPASRPTFGRRAV